MSVAPIPPGYRTVTPYLVCRGAANAIAFYERAFGARERMRVPTPDGQVAHAEIELGDSVVMLSEENPAWGAVGPQTLGGSPVSLLLYVEDVDAVFERAVDAGAKVVRPVQNQFYGDRSGHLEDPFGHRWSISSHVEEVSPEELQRRMAQMAPPQPSRSAHPRASSPDPAFREHERARATIMARRRAAAAAGPAGLPSGTQRGRALRPRRGSAAGRPA